MSQAARILVLEDNEADVELMLRELRKQGIEFTALRAVPDRRKGPAGSEDGSPSGPVPPPSKANSAFGLRRPYAG